MPTTMADLYTPGRSSDSWRAGPCNSDALLRADSWRGQSDGRDFRRGDIWRPALRDRRDSGRGTKRKAQVPKESEGQPPRSDRYRPDKTVKARKVKCVIAVTVVAAESLLTMR